MSDAKIERSLKILGKTAPRIKPSDVQANIVEIYYFTAADGMAGKYMKRCAAEGKEVSVKKLPLVSTKAMGCLTICVLVLKNGFTVTGTSACASPENFDEELGREIARENAERQIWPLMGYELRSQLAK